MSTHIVNTDVLVIGGGLAGAHRVGGVVAADGQIYRKAQRRRRGVGDGDHLIDTDGVATGVGGGPGAGDLCLLGT